MKFFNSVSWFALMAASATQATPIASDHSEATVARNLAERTDSGCTYFAAPRCCVPTVCQCANGWIYQVNQDNVNAGRHGCDPPWGIIAKSSSQFPGYCCREDQHGNLVDEDGNTVAEAASSE